MTETTITLPLPPDTLTLLLGLVGIALLSVLIFAALPKRSDGKRANPLLRITDSLGFRVRSPMTATLLFLVMLIYVIIFTLAALIALRALGGITLVPNAEVTSPTQSRAGLAFGTLLAAILGAPFIIWRSWIAAKQTAVAEDSLFNDKINAAATDLAARRQVTRSVGQDGKEVVLTEWEDDLVTRAAAIDRLEGLALEAMDRDDFGPAQRIARMLSIYVQELSRAYPAMTPSDVPTRRNHMEWAEQFRPIRRPDMERAVQSLGRINPADEGRRDVFSASNIDLRDCNFQGFDLIEVNLQGARLNKAQLQGADLRGAQLQRANLFGAQLQGALLYEAQLQRANLFGAQLQGADLRRAQLQGALLYEAQLQGAGLFEAQLQGALLFDTQISDDTDITAATLRGAAVMSVDETTLTELRAHPHWDQMFHPEERIDPDTFITQWRAFAAALDPPVTIQPDYRTP